MCDNQVYVMTRKDGTEVFVKCGEYFNETQLCMTCEQGAKKNYPQGWRHYPGDTCKHGVYVGGCGIDWMCGRCESGE